MGSATMKAAHPRGLVSHNVGPVPPFAAVQNFDRRAACSEVPRHHPDDVGSSDLLDDPAGCSAPAARDTSPSARTSAYREARVVHADDVPLTEDDGPRVWRQTSGGHDNLSAGSEVPHARPVRLGRVGRSFLRR
jgi:hypothetical protein